MNTGRATQRALPGKPGSYEGINFESMIWDGEKLEKILPKYPFIIAYHFGFDLPLFEPYHEKFKEEMKGKKPVLNHDCNFQGRSPELDQFSKFMSQEKCKIFILNGRSGVGKTRLSIEAAKKISKNRKWKPLFLRIEADKFDDHLSELLPEKRYVIFVDDAETYKNLDRLIALANRQGWSKKLKIVMITKPQFLNDLKKKIFPPYSDKNVIERQLGKLSSNETLQLMDYLGIKDQIDKRALFPKCEESPMLTVMTAFLFRAGIHPEKMSQDKVLATYLDKSLDNLRKNQKSNHLSFMEILAAVYPIPIRDENIHQKISDVLKIEIDGERQIIQDLLNEGLVEQKGGKLKITPGILAERLLESKCFDLNGNPTGFHTKIIRDFMALTAKQVINNISAIEYTSQKSLLDDFAQDLTNFIKTANNLERLNILETLADFSYFRPFDTLEIINEIIRNPQPETEHHDKIFGKWNIAHKTVLEKLPSLLEKTAENLESLKGSLDILKDLALKEEKKYRLDTSAYEKLKAICKFEYGKDLWIREDQNLFYYYENRHEIILNAFNQWLNKDNEKLHNIITELIRKLFSFECLFAHTSLEDRTKFVLTTVQIMRTDNLTAMRKKLLDIIFKIAEHSKFSSVRHSAFGVIRDALWNLFNKKSDESKESLKESDNEKKRIFEFLKYRLKKEKSLKALNNIDACLKTISDEKDKYDKLAAALIKELNQNLEYKLYKYLVGEHDDWDNFHKEDFWDNFVKEYTKHYTPAKLYNILTRITKDPAWIYGPVSGFLHSIGEKNTPYGIKLFDKIIKERKGLFNNAGYLLRGIRLKNKQKAIEYINILKSDDDSRVKKIVVDSYSQMRDYQEYTQNDMEVLKELSLSDDKVLNSTIASVLHNLDYVNKKDYLEILKNVSKKPTLQIAANVSDAIIRSNLNFTKTDMKKIERIASNFAPIPDLDEISNLFYRVERLFKKIINDNPAWLINFFEKRIRNVKKAKSSDKTYDAVPYSFNKTFHKFNGNPKYKEMLRRVRDWSLKKGWFYYESPMLFKSLCATDCKDLHVHLNSDAEMVLMEWVNSNDKGKMKRVPSFLKEFEEDESFYRIAIELIIKADGDPDTIGGLSSAIYTAGGPISRKIGSTSRKLMNRIDYLKKLEASDNFKLKRFAKKQLKITEGQVQEEREHDEDL